MSKLLSNEGLLLAAFLALPSLAAAPAVAILVFACAPSLAYPDEKDPSKLSFPELIDVAKRAIEEKKKTPSGKSDEEKFLSTMEKEDSKQRQMVLSISASFDGDSAGNNSSYTVKTRGEVSRGTYPREFRFRTGTQFQLNETEGETSTTNVNLTEVLLNYDYHPRQEIQIHGFLQRFSSDFLRIAERYEVGFGVKHEWDFGQISQEVNDPGVAVFDLAGDQYGKDKGKKKEILEYNEKVQQKLEDWICKEESSDVIDQTCKEELTDVIDRIVQKRHPLRTAYKKRQARFSPGLTVSVLGELEQGASLKSAELQGQPPGQQVFRIVLRPSFRFQPIGELNFATHFYWKLGLRDKEILNGEEKTDYRIDFDLRAEMRLDKNQDDQDKVSLVAEFRYLFDNVPPHVSFDPKQDDLVAPTTERIYGLQLKIEWGL